MHMQSVATITRALQRRKDSSGRGAGRMAEVATVYGVLCPGTCLIAWAHACGSLAILLWSCSVRLPSLACSGGAHCQERSFCLATFPRIERMDSGGSCNSHLFAKAH